MAVPTKLDLTARYEEIYFDSARKSLGLAREIRDAIQAQKGELKWLELFWIHESWNLGDEIDPEPEELELASGAVERLDEVFRMFLQATASTDVFSVMTLETHINCVASDALSGKMAEGFDRMPLENKWLFLPKLLGKEGFETGAQPYQDFSALVRRRNRLVHLKTGDRILSVEGGTAADAFLDAELRQADRATASVKRMGAKLAALLGETPPTWASVEDLTYYRLSAESVPDDEETAKQGNAADRLRRTLIMAKDSGADHHSWDGARNRTQNSRSRPFPQGIRPYC